MKLFSVLGLLVVVTIALAYFTNSKSVANASVQSGCACVDCECPDCNGVTCSCDTCECGSCACAMTSAKPVASCSLGCCETAAEACASTGCTCVGCNCPDCNGEACTSQPLEPNEHGHYKAETDRGAVLVSVLDTPKGTVLAILAAGQTGSNAIRLRDAEMEEALAFVRKKHQLDFRGIPAQHEDTESLRTLDGKPNPTHRDTWTTFTIPAVET